MYRPFGIFVNVMVINQFIIRHRKNNDAKIHTATLNAVPLTYHWGYQYNRARPRFLNLIYFTIENFTIREILKNNFFFFY